MAVYWRNKIFDSVVYAAIASATWIVATVVGGATAEAVLAEKVAQHTSRLDKLETVASSLAESHAQTVATQAAMGRVIEKLEERVSQDIRDIRNKPKTGR